MAATATERTNFVLFGMAITKQKGDLGQSIIMAKLMLQGCKVAIPVGEDWRFDLIVYVRNQLLRVQCKYITSDGKVAIIPTRSRNSYSIKHYTSDEIDWLVAYDATTERIFYIQGSMLGPKGRSDIYLRLQPPKCPNKRCLLAEDFEIWPAKH